MDRPSTLFAEHNPKGDTGIAVSRRYDHIPAFYQIPHPGGLDDYRT